MHGVMQDVPLTIELVLGRAETVAAQVEVVSVDLGGGHRLTWGETAGRARRLAGALDALGLSAAARLGTRTAISSSTSAFRRPGASCTPPMSASRPMISPTSSPMPRTRRCSSTPR